MCPLLDRGVLDLRIRQLNILREAFCSVTHTHTPHPHASVLALLLSQSKPENAAEVTPCCMALPHDAVPSAHI